MLCGTGLGMDPARPRSTPHHGRLLNRANQDKPPVVFLPDVAAGVGWQPPALLKARLRPGLPARRRKGKENPWRGGSFRQEIPAASSPRPGSRDR